MTTTRNSYQADLAWARTADRADRLAPLRRRFHHPRQDGRRPVYLCGHSLGLQPRGAQAVVDEVMAGWRERAVGGHFDGPRRWLDYHRLLTAPLARLAGAHADEVVAMNSLTVNLHLMMVSFYRPTAKRYAVLMEAGAFPSDRYAVDSQLRFHGLDPRKALLELTPRPGEHHLRPADIERTLEREGSRVALVLLPGVQYVTGQALPMARLIRVAHRLGCVVGLDLAHAMGNLPLSLHRWGADFAVWCTYKYLNGGPGAIGGCFVHRRWHESRLPRFAGWWGHDPATRFRMDDAFSAQPGADGWQISNPPVLGAAPLIASLGLFEQAGMSALAAKSRRLTGYLEYLLRSWTAARIRILTPASRGAQLSLTHRDGAQAARRLFEAMGENGIVADWREPDVIRLAPAPLYNSYGDVYRAARALRRALVQS